MRLLEERQSEDDDKQGLSEEYLRLLEERRHLLAEHERMHQLLRQRDHENMQLKENFKRLKEERNQDVLYAAALIIERDHLKCQTCSAQFLSRC